PGRVELFRSPGHPLLCSFDADYGWGDLAKGGVGITIVPGVHEKILEEPCVEVLASDLKALLQTTARAPVPVPPASQPRLSALDPSVLQWNQTLVEFPIEGSYARHFEAQVTSTPKAIALRFQGLELSYAELNARSNKLARHLQSHGVGPEQLVAVCLERSLELPIALLAILKAGGAYLPLDRSYPADRLAYMLQDSKARLLLSQTELLKELNLTHADVICLDAVAQQQQIAACSRDNATCPATLDHLAYVIYTSGSTGAPKGVEITHRALLNHNFAIAQAYKLQPADRVLQFSPFSFDISVEELFPAWLNGCGVVMRSDDDLSSVPRFLKWIREEKLSVINIPTAYWHELVENLRTETLPPTLRLLVIGGEKASPEAWRRWKECAGSSVMLINAYGPTEATVTATLHIAQPTDDALPIGRPIANTQALILDEHLAPVAVGSEGELHIGGAGLSRGYLNRPDLTAQKFVSNPFPHITSKRLYRTGDRARFRADGAIEFAGRRDEQVKIRGFRIELGEIENTLHSHPAIKDAVVTVREDVPGKKRIVAYFVPRQSTLPGVSELIGFLKSKLPAYMVPASFVPLEALPLTPSGKVDRQNLPKPGDARPELTQPFAAPRTPVEEVVASIWGEVLGLNRVGIHDNFFDLGGHSLLAIQVISRIREALQVEVPLISIFTLPTVAALAGKLADASPETQPVLPVSAVSKGRRVPLTETQKRIWFLDHFEPQQSSYNIPTTLRLKGPLNVATLEKSFTELARRHDALRAIFPADDGQPVQIICEPKEIHLQIIDLTAVPPDEREAQAFAMAVTEGRRSDVMSCPMLRPFLWRLADQDHLLLMLTHELACDAEAVRLLLQELTGLYESFNGNSPIKLAAPQLAYAEAVGGIRFQPEIERERLDFWKQKLAGAPALLDLPSDYPRPAHQRDEGACVPILITDEVTKAAEVLSRRHHCTPFETLLAAFQALLSRYTGSGDIPVGCKFSQRGQAELKGVIAKLDNTLVLRGDLSGNPTFQELLAQVRETHRAAAANVVSFERLLDELHPARNASYTPVFQVMFDYDPEPLRASSVAGVSFEPFKLYNQTAKLDLHFSLSKTAEGLSGFIEYSTALFTAERISRMAGHFKTLLEAALEDPAQPVSRLPLMPAPEAQQVLRDWNATEKPYPTTATLMSLFEQQVSNTPNATALIAGADQLTYGELNARTNQLAHYLRELNVGPGVMVGICLERSWRLLVAILGVLKAGGAYVPLDPAYPKDRLAFILEDASAPVLLTQDSLRNLLPADNARLIFVDSEWPEIHQRSRENPFSGSESHDLAYVIYTSGSTGKPKGVAIEHRPAVALVCWAKDVFTPEELSGVLASTSICFDLSIFEMFVPLSWGGTVILAQNALALPGLAAANRVTLINTVPSAIRELLRIKGVPANVQVVNLAGEPLATTIVNQIYAETQARKVYDLYGPSETTTYSTFTLRRPNEIATIGGPLANEQVYLLDANREPVPIGIPGELYIGGEKLARGYLNRPELTAEKFVANPFKPGTRLYRTGDLARWRNDGQLEYLGRIDHQVKIRGFRIELGEIETAFRQHAGVREVVVLAREVEGSSKRLVAYLVAKGGKQIATEELRRFGKEHLPEYMVPSAFVLLPEMPLTPNGKVDRKALPDPEQEPRGDSVGYVAPRTPGEEQLCAIWREVLRVQRPGVHDNFFELGGDSLLAIQVISRVRETCKVELPLFSLFEAPTIDLLAQGLLSGKWTQNQLPVLPLMPIPRAGVLPVSFVQERLWFLDQLEPGNHAYNVAVGLRLKGRLNLAALEQAFSEMAKRHEAFRTTFAYENDVLTQKIAAPQPIKIETTNLSDAAEDSESQLQRWLKTEGQRPFDLAAGPLTRVHLVRLAETDHALLVVMHHTISDGWSLTILFQELEALYEAFTDGKPAPAFPPLPLQYADFAAWKRQQMQGAVLEQELKFWKEKLKGAPDAIALPADHAETQLLNQRAGREILFLSKPTADAIGQVSHRQGSTAFVVLTAALAAALEKWTHQRDLVLGTVVAGRNRREMEDVIGCFMNFLPIRTRLSGGETGQELLAKVQAAVLEAQEHQDCPFEKIVEAVNPERRTNQNPLYNVALLLQNFPTEMFRSRHLEVSPLTVDLEAALLDLRFEAEWKHDGLSITCEFKTGLFAAETIRFFLAEYRQMIETLLHQPQTRLSEIKVSAALEAQVRAARSRKAEQIIAVAATFTAEPIGDSLHYWTRELELSADIEFAPYNQVFQQLLNPGSLLNENMRGLNVLLIRPEDWFKTNATDAEDRARELQRVAGEFSVALKAAASRSRTPFLIVLCPASGIVASDSLLRATVKSVETLLSGEIVKIGNAHVVTAEELLELYPVPDYYDASGDELGKVPYTPVFFTALGTMVARKLHALQRAPHKVIVLDCDNTLWSGVCGEDGAKGICLDAPRQALQGFMRAQQQAGRLLAVCSKNNEEDVRDVFTQRLDMPLRHEHFAAWRTNWLPKSENLKSLAQELNLGLDGFIFVDDNPVECAEVEASCPEVLTLLLPEDAAQFPAFLEHCWAFDHAKLTDEDRKRSEMYRLNQQREQLRSSANGLADFIASLDLQIEIAPMDPAQLNRVSQLTHRTNQFNCTTIRRTEAEMQQLAGHAEILTVSVKDRFGDYGLVGVAICSAKNAMLDVETFLLSCRVLGRGVEHAILAHLASLASERGLEWVDVHYHRSEKNKPAHDFLENVGAHYRQALNGGFIYRFPAKVAAEMVFAPKSGEVSSRSRGDETQLSSEAKTHLETPHVVSYIREDATPAPLKPRNTFRRYRWLALEQNSPAKIHAAIEARATSRSGKQGGYTPPETELQRQLCSIWENLLHIDQVGLKDNFFELGGHSLLAVRLFAELEKLTRRKFPLVTIFQAPTIEQLAAVLSHDDSVRSQSPIVPVQPNGHRPPLFLAHGAGGDVLWGYANLAKHLPADQPIYGIKSRGQIGLEEFDRIDDMARYYIEEIRAFQPSGPYYLGGYCLGGNVAYEMARQLRAQGDEVALVVLIDAFPSNAGYETVTWWRPDFAYRFTRNFCYWLEDFREQSAEERRRFFVRKTRILGRKLLARIRNRQGRSTEVDLEEVIDPTYFPEHELKFWEIHLRALTHHVEQSYPGAVTLIRTRGQPLLCSLAEDFCWGPLAREGVTIKHIPGSHENIFIEPNVKFLAEQLQASLAETQNAAVQNHTK
ncbi:MAG: amino acid adenylation domain-containing protein, partial [Akkermansiaceae bacterium]|nr:amino acid adenylation domain-containing protein [Verrucomicrobiales bacterium]